MSQKTTEKKSLKKGNQVYHTKYCMWTSEIRMEWIPLNVKHGGY